MISRSTDVRHALRARQRGFLLNPFRFGDGGGGGGGDPHFANVVLLLHGQGADGSTSITDSSSFGKTCSVSGTAAIDADKFLFGSSSLYSGAAGYFIASLGTDGSMSGDFTIEFFASGSVGQVLFAASGAGYLYNNNFQDYGGSVLALSTNMSAATWTHFAISRSGSTLYGFRDGVQTGTRTYSGTVNLQTLNFGRYIPNNNLYFTGHYAEIRVTKGVGRYTAAFTPPTAAFPDS